MGRGGGDLGSHDFLGKTEGGHSSPMEYKGGGGGALEH